MSRHTPFFELQVAIEESGGCPICALAVRALERFFSGLVYERVNEPRLRSAIRRASGFCAAHGVMLREARSALGIAIIQRDVLRANAARLGQGEARPQRGWRESILGGRGAGDPLRPEALCVACEMAEEQASHWAGILNQHYADLRPQLQASGGLCIDHLRAALGVASAETAALLRDDQRAIWARLEAELDEFIRKHDHQFAGEEVGGERDAWARATVLLAGDPRVTGSRRSRQGDA